ncbi:unnamed protein product [Candida verbasci]|uniref:Methionine--tRNA ligase, mitochondrial n=1 Tax=Candida verbasci TaxID=1227364 RepID=A0A9W4U0G7_9ASCO|nr:unnamed protein product [Candida verbasci]
MKRFNVKYITTPIFYVNASPHLGHAYTMLLADVTNKWDKLKRIQTFLLTGTDEHGLKIQSTAEKLKIEPKVLVDNVSNNFKVLASKLNVNYDRFIRTTDLDHVENVINIWNLMNEKGLIYKGSHSGWYSISDETFYPDSQIEEVEKDGVLKKISIETRNEVMYNEETNYFFRLSKFRNDLIKFLEENPNWIKPKHRYDQILTELKDSELNDLSISRPSSRLKWSIEVPNDPNQKIYVWFDALFNYHTFGKEINVWPPTHIIGKDIIRFHCIYWPIFLMAADMKLPNEVIVHSHWLCDGYKMSKSLGNVIDPIKTIEKYGLDTFRFFMIENSNLNEDCKFSYDYLMNTRNLLIGKYCNLINRIGGNKFNIEQAVQDVEKYQKLKMNDELKALSDELITGLNELRCVMDEHVSNFEFNKVIQCWWSIINKANTLFQVAEPWKIKDEITVNYFVYLCSETIRICSVLIQPVIPELSTKILDRLNVNKKRRTFEYAKLNADLDYGNDANSKKHDVPMKKLHL